jgi:hypothetical protein
MYERRNIARQTGSQAMQDLLRLLNADFKKEHALPDVKTEADRVEAEYLQAWLVSRLAPILGVVPPRPVVSPPDPRHVAKVQAAIAQDREAEDARAQGKQKTVECHICHRRRTIPVDARVRCSHGPTKEQTESSMRPRICEDGLRELALDLSEWAEEAKMYPRWLVKDNQLPPLSESPAERRYQGGKKVLMVSQEFSCQPTRKNSMMLNLASLLVSGEFNRLRVCINDTCRRYFYAEKLTKTHCSPECYKRRDRATAARRMQRWREKQRDRTYSPKEYFLAKLPTISNRLLRILRTQGKLNDTTMHELNDLREQAESGIHLERIWTRNSVRALFKKLQTAGVL